MTVDAVKGALDRGEDEVLDLAAAGWLVLWNIAGPQAERREVRILARSVSTALKHLDGELEEPPRWRWEDVLVLLGLAGRDGSQVKPWLTGREVQRLLNCSSTHVINLIECRPAALRVMPGTSYRSGPGGSPAVARESVIEFLRDRLEDGTRVSGLFAREVAA